MDEDRTSFDERLRAAQSRAAGKQPEEQQPDSEDKSLVAMAARAGSEMLGGLVVGVLVGWGLDRWFHYRALFLVLFAMAGGCAGILNVWRLVKPPDMGDKKS
ncbi:AtpZ/AtpI family protein [Acetobacter fallax]|uniref:F0F1 ATP synthase assembly protein I n=1 Tax=Acetobacter fallax TaxID=1737473 RepID=A0ABX0KAK8_9PROT|nr:AtpZ/AtpI family protein [Acetobacter fallax]NHO33196.1 F0F1 ATP synthase assembly protein I [Acetobacter fallax]NHO36770.1 F0F1 ATP synthase assembly protein I [Acetobacter fallax]